ncbi:ribokinase [Salinarimonas soli]|uniref:Ribokinase n=1 Tax=Salinarimonas soli TaxID=1638099 RepID=A0A5B2VA98_9HYPH|nr:ribokinase [Salinarimonas soli]KAA2235914.1 ribokinase [Salinarimonas soli]
MTRVFVLGNATLDVILYVDRMPAAGETRLASSMTRCAGGKGLNQAVVASRAGARTILVTPVGADADGGLLQAALEGEPNLEAEWLPSGAPTDVSCIWVADSGENMIVSTAASAHAITRDDALHALARIEAGDILLVQGNLGPATTLAACSVARTRGARTILNTAPIAWDQREVLSICDVVVANEPECHALLGPGGTAAAFLRLGPSLAVVTLGSRGAVLADESGQRIVPAPRVQAVDTAGAGDVLTGVLAAELASGSVPQRALEIAVAAASLSVTRPGTSPSFPAAAEIEHLRAIRHSPVRGSDAGSS